MERIEFERSIREQPRTLERVLDSVTQSLEDADIPAWRPGESVGVYAMGASSHSAHALVSALLSRGVSAHAFTASDVRLWSPGLSLTDHHILISESGRSPEPIAAAQHLPPGRRIGITNVPDSPITTVVDAVLPFGDVDDGGVYTVGYTATLLTYALVARHQGIDVNAHPEDIPTVVADALATMAEPAGKIVSQLASTRHVDFVGSGMSRAAAGEGALVFREALGIPTSTFETYQYLHGPMEPLGRESLVIVFGDDREITLADSLLDSEVRVCLVTATPDAVPRPEHRNLTVAELPSGISGFSRSAAEVVLPQLIAAGYARVVGRTPGRFQFRQSDTKLPE